MELERIRRILELPGGAAFAVSEGTVLCATAEAEALGFLPGVSVAGVLPEGSVAGLLPGGSDSGFLHGASDAGPITALTLPEAGAAPLEAAVSLGGSVWRLRAAAEEDCALCFLRPETGPSPAPNENTLLHAAGSIRLALHDVTTALETLTDPTASAEPSRSGGLALRGVYRLRRAAQGMELYARLRGGAYPLACRELSVLSTVSAFLGELSELLQAARITLSWELPQREFLLRLDWPLIAVLLQELIANAAANTADGHIRVKLTQAGDRRLLFAISNRPTEPLPKDLFSLHAEPQQSLSPGIGLGLSLVSAGAACHGGSLLLSTDRDGTVTALLSVAAEEGEGLANRSFLQLPTGAEAELTALSPVLPPELFRPEALL